MNTYKLRMFDSQGRWFSTKTVADNDQHGPAVTAAIDETFNYWNPGTCSAVEVGDAHGTLRRVTYVQWNRGRNESTAARLVDQMLSEETSLNPHYTTNASVKSGDSHVVATQTRKEGDEYQQTGEERREIAIADRLLKAAKNMAKTPDVDEIVRLATELKNMHGVQ